MRVKKVYLLFALLAVWTVVSKIFNGQQNLQLPTADNTPVTSAVSEAAASIRGNRTEGTAFVYFFNPIRGFINGFVEIVRTLIAIPAEGSIIPIIGWLGFVALLGLVVYATSNWRTSVLAITLLLACGALGMWNYTMDTFAMTIAAVLLSLAIGMPLGIWEGRSDRGLKV